MEESEGRETKRTNMRVEVGHSAVTKQAAGVWLDSLNSLWVDWIFGWKGMSCLASALVVSSRCYNMGSLDHFFLRGWRGKQTFAIATFVAKYFLLLFLVHPFGISSDGVGQN